MQPLLTNQFVKQQLAEYPWLTTTPNHECSFNQNHIFFVVSGYFIFYFKNFASSFLKFQSDKKFIQTVTSQKDQTINFINLPKYTRY